MSADKKGSGTPRWFVYFVIVAMGMAFTTTLVTIAWNNALERAQREFSLASRTLKENLLRNISVGHNTINSLSIFLAANPDLKSGQLEEIVSSLFSEYPYFRTMMYCSAGHDAGKGDAGYRVLFDFKSNANTPAASCADIMPGGRAGEMLSSLLDSGNVRTVADRDGNTDGRHYWMLKRVVSDETVESAPGFLAMLVDIPSLLGGGTTGADLSITLHNDSSALGGRQLLYSHSDDRNVRWAVARLSEESISQFPDYSLKLGIDKPVGFAELDKELVYNALFVGFGVTILMIALVRARDRQEQQLRERNIVIERQVEEQTRQLAIARDKALDASKVKSEFLASMSHEIRTPLNAIIGMSELLAETPLNNEQKKYTDVFRKAGDTLLSLVNDILDLSKIEAGQLELEEIEFDFVEVVEESLEIYALKAAEKKVELCCEIEPGMVRSRTGDPARLRQIILNLVSNALKFTDSGEIVVSAATGEDNDSVQFTVSDTGIGIPSGKLQIIFESFSQVDSSTTRKYGGTGLGLSICKSLVDLMAGRIWVESEPGEGSRFRFTVRLPAAESAKSGQQAAQDLSGGRVLIVDDNPTVRRVLSAQLASAGADTTEAGNASEALRTLERISCDLVLVDYCMPDMDGLELCEKIRSENRNLPLLLMVDGVELNKSVKGADRHHHDGYVVKPIKQGDLYRQIAGLLGREGTSPDEQAASRKAQEERPLRILLVDDNSDNRLLVNAYLKKLPYELDEAENGEQAVTLFRAADYDIVLMDVQMPVMDGREAMRRIRAWESETGRTPTPIIALTAHAIREEIDECLQAGSDSHLAKPVKKAVLIETIQKLTA